MNNKQKQIRYIFFAVLNVSFILITFYAFFACEPFYHTETKLAIYRVVGN